jgi:hypothetical protein
MSRQKLTSAERTRHAYERVETAASNLIRQAEKLTEGSDYDRLIATRMLLAAAREYGAAMRALARLAP